MLTVIIILLLGFALLIALRAPREWIVEEVKHLSDKLLLRFLRNTSQFERELTQDGKLEQAMWREQRLRDLQGLSARSRQRFEGRNKSA